MREIPLKNRSYLAALKAVSGIMERQQLEQQVEETLAPYIGNVITEDMIEDIIEKLSEVVCD